MSVPALGAGYTLLGPLPGGAGGSVLALDPAGRRVVVKSGPGTEAEADALARVDHPGCVRLLDRGVVAGVTWLAVGWIEGRDLDALRGRADAETIRHVARGIAAALGHLHGIGLVHGDVKPANVRLTTDGDPILLDLGSAAPIGATRRGGTAPYVPPGVRRDDPADPADDAYALAVLLATLTLGHVPWADAPAHALPSRGALDLPDAPDDLRFVIRALTEPDAARRLPLARVSGALGVGRAPQLSATVDLAAPDAAARATPEASPPATPDSVARPSANPAASATPQPDGDAAARPTPDVPAAGNVGGYALRAELGRGGMGVVYRAWDPRLRREVALKLAANGDRDRFLREARAAAGLDHPAIVRILEVGDGPAGPFLAMELVDGPSMASWIADRGPVPADRAAQWVAALARALGHAHARGVVHRDVKPSNVLLDDGDALKLVDFGLAHVAHGDSVGRTGSALLGTPRYLAPEQILGRPTDARVDVWGIGLVLYELLVGHPAFDGPNAASVMHAILDGAPPSPRAASPRVPVGLDRIVRRATARDPDHRYPSMEALLVDLDRWLAGGDVRLPAAIARAAARVWVRRHAFQLAIGAAAAAVCLVGLGLLGQRAAVAWQAAADEREAADAWAATRSRLAALREEGRAADAEIAFQAFVTSASWRGTRAPARAWLDRAAEAARPEDARAAFARAYFEATHDAERAAALDGLARDAANRWAWEALAGMVAAKAPDPDGARSRMLGWATGEVPEGPLRASGVEAALHALTGATRTAWSADQLLPVTVDGHPGLALGRSGRLTGAIVGVDHPSLPAIRQLPPDDLDGSHLAPVRGAGGLLARRGGRNEVARVGPAGLVVDVAFDGPSALGVWRGDLYGDGRDEVFAGTGPYERRLRGFRSDGGAFSPFVPHPATDAAASDVARVDAADLDGDGDLELIVLLGAWGAFDVRVLEHDPDSPGQLRLVDRMRLGGGTDVALLPDPRGGTRLVVPVRHRWSAPLTFGEDRPFGADEGVWVLALRDGALVAEARVPTPLACAWAYPGDFDGDGIADVAIDCGQGTAVLRQAADGALDVGAIRRVQVRGAADVDQDGRDELLVTLADDPTGHVWVLGAGSERPPIDVTAPAPAPAPAAARGPLARRWARAEELLTMGLVDEAIDTFVAVADLADTPPMQGLALRRAASLRPAARCLDAVPLLEDAARRDPASASDDYDRIAACALDTMAWGLAVDAVDRQLADPLAPAEARLRARERRAWLEARHLDAAVVFDLARGTPASIGVVDPLALRETSGGLAFVADRATLLAVPVQWDGAALELGVDLDLDRLEWAATLDLALIPEGGEGAYGVALSGLGGGGTVRAHLRARWGEASRGDPSWAPEAGPVALRIHSEGSRWRVTARAGSRVWEARSVLHGDAPPPGRYTLALRARPEVDTHALVSGTLRSITMRGPQILTAPDPDPASRALTLRRPDRVGPDASALARVVAADDRGDAQAARAAFGALSDHDVLRLMRARPERALGWAEASRPDWLALAARAFEGPLYGQATDPADRRLLIERFGPISSTPPPDDADALDPWIALHAARARALRAAGRAEAALTEVDRLLALAPTRSDLHLERARALAGAGDRDEAFRALGRALELAPSPLVLADRCAADPALVSLRADPRWAAVVQALRLGGDG